MKLWNRCCCCWPLRCVCKPKPEPAAGSFTAVKYDQDTGRPLADAGYTLYQNENLIATAISDESGRLSFTDLAPGEYTLIETTIPAGYLPERTSHQVVVDEDGTVMIDGIPADNFSLYDVPNRDAEISFRKVDADTGQPLAGAVFTMPNGVRAVSGSDGVVNFGIFGPGSYVIQEVTAPEGYAAVQTDFTVVVTTDGRAFIDGTSIANFTAKNTRLPDPSQRPVINAVTEGDHFVTGTGVPGAEIAVTLPDGIVVTTTVNDSGIWVAAVPQGTDLQAGQTIYAIQTEIGRGPSAAASFEVQAKTFQPVLTKK